MEATDVFTTPLERAADPRGPARPWTGEGAVAPTETRNVRDGTVLVLGGAGVTGRRVVERLAARGLPVRVGPHAPAPPFDWEDQATWGPALCGADGVYIPYDPDLAVPGGVERLCLFAALAVELGVRRLVLLSGRGGMEARCAEDVIRGASAEWTILRSRPWVDTDDAADLAVAALTEDGHSGRLYELTGQR